MKMISKTSLFRSVADIIFALVLCVLPVSAVALDLSPAEQEYLQSKENIVFVSQSHYPPFEFTDEQNQHQGMMPDVVNWLAIEIGFRPVFVDTTFIEAQNAVLSGEADIITSLFFSDQRQEKFAFTTPLFDVPALIFVHSRRPDLKGLQDLQGKVIAIQRGDYAKEFLESQNIQFTTLDTEDFAEATDAVIADQADAVIGDEQIVLYHVYKNRLTERIKSVGAPLYIGSNCMAASRNNAILVSILNKGIKEARKKGVLDKISKKWLGTQYQDHRSFISRYWLPFSLASCCVLLLTGGIWIWNLRLRSLVSRKTAEIREREQALRESERNFRSFFDTVEDLIVVSDTSGQIFYANPAAIETLGLTRERLLASNLVDIHCDGETDEMQEALTAISRGEAVSCPLPLRHDSGVEIPAESRGWRGSWNGRDCIFCLSKDLSKEQEALQKFNTLFNSHPTPMLVSDLQNNCITDLNTAFLKTFGFSRSEIIGKTGNELGLFIDTNAYPTILNQLRTDTVVSDYRVEARRKDWRRLEILYTGTKIALQGKQYLLSILVDESQRLTTEKELKQSEAKFKAIFDNSLDGIFFTEEKGSIFTANPAACGLLGYSEKEICAGGRDLVMDTKDPRLLPALRERSLTGNFMGELRMKRKDGSRLEVELSSSIFSWENDETRASITFRDISERKKAATALRESEEKYRVIFNNEIYAICIFDLTTLKLLDINDAYCRLYGYSRKELLSGMTIHDITAEKQPSDKATRQAVEQGTIFIPLRYHRKKDGTVFPVEIVGGPYVWNGQKVMFALAHDITDRKSAEDERVEILQEKQVILDTVNIGITKVIDRKQVWSNQKACDLFGYSREEFENADTSILYATKEDYSELGKKAYPVLAMGQVYDTEQLLLRKDGTPLWIRLIGKAIDAADPSKGSIWLIEDVSERKQAELALQRSELRLSLALRATQDAIWDWDLSNNILYYSPQWWHQIGYGENELKSDPELWRRLMHPDDRERADGVVEKALRQESSFEIETRLQHKDHHYVPILTRGVILRDTDNTAIRVSGTNTDLTERKLIEKERKKAERQRQQLEKTKSLNRMAGAIAHNFNNMMTVVIGNLELALMKLPPGTPDRSLKEAKIAAEKAASTSTLMLTYLGQSYVEYGITDLSALCKRVAEAFAARIPKGFSLTTSFRDPGPKITANADQIELLINNLADNAIEACHGVEGSTQLSVGDADIGEISTGNRFPVDWKPSAKKFAMFAIADSGTGISEGTLDQIFDPFYSTKFAGRGLGLAVVLGIVRAHNGVITVENGESSGTIFRVFFPLVKEQSHMKQQ